MRCPDCGNGATQVKDSRPSEDNSVVRRRRECASCGARFTTFERMQLRELMVVKRSGEHRPFDREKLFRSISIATRKRNIRPERIELLVDEIAVRLAEAADGEPAPSSRIGLMVMEALKKVDAVSFVRFASVYHDFKNVEDFSRFLAELSSQDQDDADG